MYILKGLKEVVKDLYGYSLKGNIHEELTVGEVIIQLINTNSTADYAIAVELIEMGKKIPAYIRGGTSEIEINKNLVQPLTNLLDLSSLLIPIKAYMNTSLIIEKNENTIN